VSEWQGYDAAPQEQREFPDLSPIRPRDARTRDGRAQGDRQGEQAQPGQPGQRGHGGRHPGDGPGSDPSAPVQANPRYGAGQYRGGGYQGGGPTGAGRGGPGQAPWADEDWQQQPPTGQRTGQPGLASTQQAQSQQAQPQQALRGQQDEDVPSWAEPDSVEAFTARWHRRGLDPRDDQRSDRRKRRRVLFAGGGVAAVVIAVAMYFLLIGGGGSADLGFGSLVTTFLPGEVQSVPDACNTVPAGLLTEYLPGTLKQAAPPLNTGANSECTWTLDNAPTYRVLQVQLEAYSPSALYGNGSATVAAEVAYGSSRTGYTNPGPKSGAPTATVTDLSGMPGGNDTSAFEATQVFNRDGAITDVATVYVRYRNVIVTVVVDGLDQASGAKKYGPVAVSDLSAAAKSVAKQVAGQIVR